MNLAEIVLVTPNDEILGVTDKITAHQYGLLHRAFSVFIYRIKDNNLQILLQQRQFDKYHCGGLWTNSCCSHPTLNQTITEAASLRLIYELGVSADLIVLGRFHYLAKLDNGYFENELDYVLSGFNEADVIPYNKIEVNTVQWLTVDNVLDWLNKKPDDFTPWFKQALDLFLTHHFK